MQLIQLETKIAAPPERCFLLSLSIDLHMQSAAPTRERAIAGVAHGLIGHGETVTWQGRHFGFMIQHQSRITTYKKPTHFQDVMTRGLFRSFTHDHFFAEQPDGKTIMRDELRFSAPLWPLGFLAERLILKRYLTRFLLQRNREIKRVAEGPASLWEPYLYLSKNHLVARLTTHSLQKSPP
jgi:ligand-binding SRPBCC domain-containing protein